MAPYGFARELFRYHIVQGGLHTFSRGEKQTGKTSLSYLGIGRRTCSCFGPHGLPDLLLFGGYLIISGCSFGRALDSHPRPTGRDAVRTICDHAVTKGEARRDSLAPSSQCVTPVTGLPRSRIHSESTEHFLPTGHLRLLHASNQSQRTPSLSARPADAAGGSPGRSILFGPPQRPGRA